VTETFKPPSFAIEIERHGTTAIVAIVGEFDLSTMPQVTGSFESLEPGYEKLVIDLSRCTFFASSGISLLLEQNRRAAEERFELMVIKPPPEVQRMFALVGLDEELTFQDP
jgi:anti-sigma B factor antagonist